MAQRGSTPSAPCGPGGPRGIPRQATTLLPVAPANMAQRRPAARSPPIWPSAMLGGSRAPGRPPHSEPRQTRRKKNEQRFAAPGRDHQFSPADADRARVQLGDQPRSRSPLDYDRVTCVALCVPDSSNCSTVAGGGFAPGADSRSHRLRPWLKTAGQRPRFRSDEVTVAGRPPLHHPPPHHNSHTQPRTIPVDPSTPGC